MKLAGWLKRLIPGSKELAPSRAYDLWAEGYDAQPGNLMLDMDEELFGNLLGMSKVTGELVADIGCGTGRHWKRILQKNPKKLVGYDVSARMLEKLKEKFPAAETHLLTDHRLKEIPDGGCGLVISTLAIAHIENIEAVLEEWDRIIQPGGEVIITDYHPEALLRGGRRTFRHGGKVMAVRNYIHPIEKIRKLGRQRGWTELRFSEKVIDDSVKGYYEKQDALQLFEQFREVPIIYGIHFKKQNP
jgi:ubiquinone/menaquinone biosynthesis C-methylase UbiE